MKNKIFNYKTERDSYMSITFKLYYKKFLLNINNVIYN